jgi:hypothetical protein
MKKKPAKQDEKNNNNSISGAKQHDRPSKRRKVTINTANPTASTSPTRITCLPLEILAEIFSYISSPRTVLALARSSKFFCATFTSPTADFIWRARCASSPIPDPTPNFTEAAYAAFIFDAGVCDVRSRFILDCSLLCGLHYISDLRDGNKGDVPFFCASGAIMQQCASHLYSWSLWCRA